ncbi:MAG: hypothetical protein AVO35_10590 [Candidatus Aegiribacteria sp. MLS_C]|nr:MAG: hypothetical protein AVO35_10590 [Candidatus Aegiribacteria sp. MLS_C]
MGPRTIALTVVLLTVIGAEAVGSGHLQVLADLDREVSGLLDAYLEAVPECPVRSDTPIRVWVLDLAWLRAGAAIDSLLGMDAEEFLPDSQLNVWRDFTSSTESIFRIYSDIQSLYHTTSLPDSLTCIEMEDRLITADSTWRHAQMTLLDILSEEGNQ